MESLEIIRKDLVDPDKGFYVIRSLYSADEVNQYLNYCEEFIYTGPKIHTRINTDNMFDYVHPRSHDEIDRTFRIYQFFHNHESGFVSKFLYKAIELRKRIESQWAYDKKYELERMKLQNYTIVTSYKDNYGMLPRHKDYDGPAPFPLIQFWVLLSQPEIDYRKGNLVLHTRSGVSYALERDFDLKPGDAVIFDKSLYHEVEETKTGAGDLRKGRWTVLIGARAERDPSLLAIYKRLRYSNLLNKLAKTVKRKSNK